MFVLKQTRSLKMFCKSVILCICFFIFAEIFVNAHCACEENLYLDSVGESALPDFIVYRKISRFPSEFCDERHQKILNNLYICRIKLLCYN